MPDYFYLYHWRIPKTDESAGGDEFGLYEDRLDADYMCLDKPGAEVISLVLIKATPWM